MCIPRSFHSHVPSNFDGSHEPVLSGFGEKIFSQYCTTYQFACPSDDVAVSSTETRSSSKHYINVPNEPPYEATHAALPEMAAA